MYRKTLFIFLIVLTGCTTMKEVKPNINPKKTLSYINNPESFGGYNRGYYCIPNNQMDIEICKNNQNEFLQIINMTSNGRHKAHYQYYSKQGHIKYDGIIKEYPVGKWRYYNNDGSVSMIKDFDKEFIFTKNDIKKWADTIGIRLYIVDRDIINNTPVWIINLGGYYLYLDGVSGKIVSSKIVKKPVIDNTSTAIKKRCFDRAFQEDLKYKKILERCGKMPGIITD